MIRMKKVHSANMPVFENITVKVNNNHELEAEIYVFSKDMHVVYIHDDKNLPMVVYKDKDCVLGREEGQPPDIVLFHYMPNYPSNFIMQVRFATPQAKAAFLECTFAPRDDGFGNSSSS